jgi:glycosyltransferase involved in cell wall biosynthesis
MLKVFFKYSWGNPDSPYYKYLLSYPPSEVDYVNTSGKEYDIVSSSKRFEYLRILKLIIRKILRFSPVAPVFKVQKGNYELIHAAHCLIRNKNQPYVVDMEHIINFTATSSKILANPLIKFQIKRILLRKNLKTIMAWTEESKSQVKNVLGKDFYKKIENKIKVVYPAVPFLSFQKKKSHKFKIIFIARYFYDKGGLYVCEVFKKLKKNYLNVELQVVGNCPKEFEKKYPQVKFTNFIPRDKLMKEYFSQADLFLYPGFSDTFGFAFLEALSLGIPVVTVDGVARREVIEDGKYGFVVDRPNNLNAQELNLELVSSLVKSCEKLIKNKKLHTKFSRAAQEEVVDGKFSIRHRNKEIRKIYEGALR